MAGHRWRQKVVSNNKTALLYFRRNEAETESKLADG